ncbi:MAG TPA: choice-of-anchor L domain-containing protein [Bacteroidia bacterium]|jgi:hypothetical protein|nr:choice-of-anchor L domain-containing protein [Bacteroidia bacterium]
MQRLLHSFFLITHPFRIKSFAFLMGLFLLTSPLFAQLAINDTVSAQQLVNTIVGSGFNVSNAKLTCAPGAAATFTSSSNTIFEKGILLTTGRATIAKGPNNNKRATFVNGTPGDATADTTFNVTTYDGCALEFDFIPSCDSLKIKYVFGSEEYPDYVDKTFSDVVAFFISGPGINGSKNIAVNAKDGGPDYFIDNTNGTVLQYNGYTKPLTATRAVTPSSTYHLKILVADVADGSYDSGVFLEAAFLHCGPMGIATATLKTGVQIYPNPANDVLYVLTPQNGNRNVSVKIYSVVGKVVYQENYMSGPQAHPINTSTIEANGIYFIQLESDNETITKKININH